MIFWYANLKHSPIYIFHCFAFGVLSFIGLDKQGPGIQLVAVSTAPGPSETFEVVRNKDDKNRVRIKAPNGNFVQVRTERLVTADFSGNSNWGDDDPSVFTMRIAATMKGEFQITNGYGREKAAKVLRVRETKSMTCMISIQSTALTLLGGVNGGGIGQAEELAHRLAGLYDLIYIIQGKKAYHHVEDNKPSQAKPCGYNSQFVLAEHWKTFIVEQDFKFVAENGLTAVRIPVGWWIASDPTPPSPFVGGSLQTLDNAFQWAAKYGVKVIIDLHGAPGSQNGWEHSGARDRFPEWGKTDENIQQTVAVIEFLAARYAKRPNLLAVQLINEPSSPAVSLKALTNYYKAGYSAIRKHSSTAYVIMANRQGSEADPKEFLSLAGGRANTVIDVHYYNMFSDIFDSMKVQQNIDFVRTNRSTELNVVTTSNGPLSFVGEWVAEWQVRGATKEQYQEFAKAQLEVYGRASFGWAYWTLKNVNNHWSMEWMIKNNYITL
ncbi:hypothetical protein ACLOJK_016194 [Asimina triloba]